MECGPWCQTTMTRHPPYLPVSVCPFCRMPVRGIVALWLPSVTFYRSAIRKARLGDRSVITQFWAPQPTHRKGDPNCVVVYYLRLRSRKEMGATEWEYRRMKICTTLYQSTTNMEIVKASTFV